MPALTFDLCEGMPSAGQTGLLLEKETVAAVYDRRRSASGDIVGGHRPPLQFPLSNGLKRVLGPRSGPAPPRDGVVER